MYKVWGQNIFERLNPYGPIGLTPHLDVKSAAKIIKIF